MQPEKQRANKEHTSGKHCHREPGSWSSYTWHGAPEGFGRSSPWPQGTTSHGPLLLSLLSKDPRKLTKPLVFFDLN